MAAKPRPIEPERYYALLAAFRQNPGNLTAVVKATSLSRQMVKRAWEDGWTSQGLPAIKATVREEQLLAQAALWDTRAAEIREVERKKAEDAVTEIRQDALGLISDSERRARKLMQEAEAKADSTIKAAEVRAKAQLQAIMDSAKVDAAMSLAAEIRVVRGMRETSLALRQLLAEVLTPEVIGLMAGAAQNMLMGEAPDFPGFAKALATVATALAKTGRDAVEVERIRLGKPVHVIGVQEVEVSLDEAEKVTKQAAALVEAMRRKKGAAGAANGAKPPSGEPGANGAGSNSGGGLH